MLKHYLNYAQYLYPKSFKKSKCWHFWETIDLFSERKKIVSLDLCMSMVYNNSPHVQVNLGPTNESKSEAMNGFYGSTIYTFTDITLTLNKLWHISF